MAIVRVGSDKDWSTSSNGFTSKSVDTTGANFIVVELSETNGAAHGAITDSKGNTWTEVASDSAGRRSSLWYAFNATVGTGHTFSVSGTANFPSIAWIWYSGLLTTDPFDTSDTDGSGLDALIDNISLTPSVDNCLVIAGGSSAASPNPATVSGGFTVVQTKITTDFGSEQVTICELIQTAKTAASPTITPGVAGAQFLGGSIASFKPAAVAASVEYARILKPRAPGIRGRLIGKPLPKTSGATAFTQTNSGAIVPTGTQVKGVSITRSGATTPGGLTNMATAKTIGGTVTPAGIGVKAVSKILAGALTPSGAITQLKTMIRTLVGAITPTGTLKRDTALSPDGSIGPSGTHQMVVGKNLGGSITPTGTLAAIRAFLQSLAGSIASSGTLKRDTAQTRTGAITPTGTKANAVSKTLTGSLTPAGALNVIRAFLQSLAGSIASSGTLRRATSKTLPGAVTPSGTKANAVSKTLTGGITPTGALQAIRAFLQTLAGSITPGGTLRRSTGKNVTGTVGPAGTQVRATSQHIVGGIQPTGALNAIRAFLLTITGSITPAGRVVKQVGKNLAGVLAPAGSIRRDIARIFGGIITAVGVLIHSGGQPDLPADVDLTLTQATGAEIRFGRTASATITFGQVGTDITFSEST